MTGRNFISNETANRMINSIAYTENIGDQNRAPRRRAVRSRGGGGVAGSRAYVKITSSSSAEKYKGDVLTSPSDSTVIIAGVDIHVKGAEENALPVGFSDFADLSGGVYYLNGDLLA